MQQKNYQQEILALIHSGLPQAELAEKLSDYHENDLADALAALTPDERQKLYAVLGVDTVAEIFSYLDDAEPYLKELPSEKAANVVSHMDSDDAVDALDDLEEEDKAKIVGQLDKDSAEDVKMLLSYGEDEIGSSMTTNYICIRKDMTIRQAMSELVKQAGENDNISTLYVVDENDKFYGAIDLKDLIIARAEDSLEKLIARSYPYVTDHEKISDCIDRIVDYAERSLPVLNDAGELVGIITSADVVELVDDEMGDDYAKLGGLTSEEDLNEGVFESVKKRLPWLIALLFLGMLVSSVVGAFESVVAVLPIVICFQSMVLDMAGNVGTQSLAVTIRVLVDASSATTPRPSARCASGSAKPRRNSTSTRSTRRTIIKPSRTRTRPRTSRACSTRTTPPGRASSCASSSSTFFPARRCKTSCATSASTRASAGIGCRNLRPSSSMTRTPRCPSRN